MFPENTRTRLPYGLSNQDGGTSETVRALAGRQLVCRGTDALGLRSRSTVPGRYQEKRKCCGRLCNGRGRRRVVCAGSRVAGGVRERVRREPRDGKCAVPGGSRWLEVSEVGNGGVHW